MSIVFSTYFERLDNSVKKKHISFKTNSGTKVIPTYEYKFVDGIKTLVKTGETDIYSLIQAHAPEADIHNILAKFLNGDDSVLNKVVGTFGDFTDCPTTYAEMFDRVQKCKNIFDTLPVDLKEKFDNSYEKFWSDFGSDHFDSAFNDYNKSLEVKTSPASDTSVVEKGVTDAE